ncbi:Regulator of chromosome condensation 1/beta-lactamase-inhibitor protein II [Pseudocohnilembus persalinus]|uniref:Regulator of chromosome condensation 1/beta-lactamase-inhibitor protein II n=1 Tax=Pseudocohnilembus persalinus TaxID=266149 RepID=A0A0V0QMG1_PSEPJ|nr:Regulator of chromosome condensation 1/beta-lactamase-inhibitor protein II [Pseudocohnilembus persalinus]|eukprot:KRX03451.1 Regulator of chromosome condensation 1/beta-lactamase-inhibitor protein II [Pseudocohnilembus persalinus]
MNQIDQKKQKYILKDFCSRLNLLKKLDFLKLYKLQYVYVFEQNLQLLGNLYTWGLYSAGTGFNLHNESPEVNVPKRLSQFDGKVDKVVMGPYHSAVITTEGQLYTMGSGKYGALGLNNAFQSYPEPQLVEFFAEKNLKVTDAVLGEQLSVVVTDNGEVWTFGYGGTYDFKILDWINPRTGGLGSGQNTHRFEPGKVEIEKPAQISVGDNFVITISQDGKVINWGNGADGALADGACEGILSPQVNENFELLREHEGLTIQKIQSASHFSVALMSDGNLYSWGKNNQGSLGIRQNLGHRTDDVATLPTKVANQYFKDHSIVDFSVGENSLVILTDNNEVYWSGLDLAFKPIRWEIPTDKKIKQVVASKDSFAALTEDGYLYSYNNFVQNARWIPGSEYSVSNNQIFGNEQIQSIGGKYGIKYAITN